MPLRRAKNEQMLDHRPGCRLGGEEDRTVTVSYRAATVRVVVQVHYNRVATNRSHRASTTHLIYTRHLYT